MRRLASGGKGLQLELLWKLVVTVELRKRELAVVQVPVLLALTCRKSRRESPVRRRGSGWQRLASGRDGHAVEGEASSQFGVGVLVAAAAVVEVPEVVCVEPLVGDDGGVLVVASSGVEEVELEVLAGLVRDLAAVEHDAADLVPGADREPVS